MFPEPDRSRFARIEEVNRIYGTNFQLGQVVSYDAEKGRGRRLATITDAEDGFLKLMRDGDRYEYQALWDAVEIHPENAESSDRAKE